MTGNTLVIFGGARRNRASGAYTVLDDVWSIDLSPVFAGQRNGVAWRQQVRSHQ